MTTRDCVQCSAIKNNGKRCKNTTCKLAGLCYVHLRLVEGLEVKQSHIKGAGQGLITARAFKKNERIAGYGGVVLSQEEYAKKPSGYGIHLNSKEILDGRSTQSGIGRYANACRKENQLKGECKGNNARLVANVKAKNASIRTTKAVKKGSEIFIPYGKRY
jgi:hypothetical protein